MSGWKDETDGALRAILLEARLCEDVTLSDADGATGRVDALLLTVLGEADGAVTVGLATLFDTLAVRGTSGRGVSGLRAERAVKVDIVFTSQRLTAHVEALFIGSTPSVEEGRRDLLEAGALSHDILTGTGGAASFLTEHLAVAHDVSPVGEGLGVLRTGLIPRGSVVTGEERNRRFVITLTEEKGRSGSRSSEEHLEAADIADIDIEVFKGVVSVTVISEGGQQISSGVVGLGVTTGFVIDIKDTDLVNTDGAVEVEDHGTSLGAVIRTGGVGVLLGLEDHDVSKGTTVLTDLAGSTTGTDTNSLNAIDDKPTVGGEEIVVVYVAGVGCVEGAETGGSRVSNEVLGDVGEVDTPVGVLLADEVSIGDWSSGGLVEVDDVAGCLVFSV